MEDVINYIDFKLESAYFVVGKSIFKQKAGLPMEGLLSACLACIDSMVQEFKYPKLWTEEVLSGAFLCRFRDNILIIILRIITEQEKCTITDKLNHLFGPELTVKFEESSNTNIDFLESQLSIEGNTISLIHHNKNFIGDQYTRKIIRYPNILSAHPPYIFTGIITGAIKKAWRSSTTIINKVIAISRTIHEFLYMGYNTRWINKAMNMAHLPIYIAVHFRKALQEVYASFGNTINLDRETLCIN